MTFQAKATTRMTMVQGWVLEQCCPGLAGLLDGLSLSQPVHLPLIEEITDEQMYTHFAQLVEFAYTGSADISLDCIAPLWALATSLGFQALKVCFELSMLGDWNFSCGCSEAPRVTLSFASASQQS
jgi:hypothetical protein